MEHKQQIRAETQAKWAGIDQNADNNNVSSVNSVLISELENYKQIMFYYPMEDEVNILPTLEWNLDRSSEIILMRFGKNKTMIPYAIEDFDDLEENKHGILVPDKSCRRVDISQLEAVVVPGRAFDRQLNRIGRGYGYYDRFFSDYNLKKIGVAYEFQILDSVPVEDHDIGVDVIVTESKVYKK